MKNLISTTLKRVYRRARHSLQIHKWENNVHNAFFACRDFLFYISGPKIRATNPLCSLKTQVVCDRSEPTVTFNLREYNSKSVELFASSFTFQCVSLSSNSFMWAFVSYNVERYKKKNTLRNKKMRWLNWRSCDSFNRFLGNCAR